MEALLAVLATCAVGYAWWTQLRANRALAGARQAVREAGELSRRLRTVRETLRRHIDILKAIRDMALVANEDVSIGPILTVLTQIVERLLGSQRVFIYLPDTSGRLRLCAVRSGGVSRVEGPYQHGPDAFAERAAREEAVLSEEEEGVVILATPLPADGELAGVLVAELAGREVPDSVVRECERTLQAVAKHVALAIRKPTLYDRAVTDQLTCLYTKRHFVEESQRFLAQCRRSGEPLSLLILDLDHFKRINDTYGHLTGDLVLSEVAACLRAGVRAYDVAFRYGGEEMVVLAPQTGLDDARALAQRLRRAIEALELETADGERVRVTASFGVSSYSPWRDTPEAMLAAADEALYEAKRGGRNRVAVSPELEPGGEARKAPPEHRAPPDASARRDRASGAPSSAHREAEAAPAPSERDVTRRGA